MVVKARIIKSMEKAYLPSKRISFFFLLKDTFHNQSPKLNGDNLEVQNEKVRPRPSLFTLFLDDIYRSFLGFEEDFGQVFPNNP